MPSPRRPAAPPVEIEAKIRVGALAPLRRRLKDAGARRLSPRKLETNTLFDRLDGGLRASGRSFRVRRFGSSGTVTLKGAARMSGGLKSRVEFETEVASPEVLAEILGGLGFVPLFRYEKFRETWSHRGTVVCLDDTPLGCFVEVEGHASSIRRTVAALGLDLADSLTDSYPALWNASGRDGHMIFGEDRVPPRSRR